MIARDIGPQAAVRMYAILVLIVGTGASSCRWGEEATLGFTIMSPDSAYVARYFQVAGGGAAGFVNQVVDVRPVGEAFEWSRWRDEAVFIAGNKQVALTWIHARHLVVEYGEYNGEWWTTEPPATAKATKGPVALSYRLVTNRPTDAWGKLEWVRLPAR